MTPFGGFVPLAAFFEKLGLLNSIAAHCPAVRTSPNASAVRDVLTSFILSCLCDGAASITSIAYEKTRPYVSCLA